MGPTEQSAMPRRASGSLSSSCREEEACQIGISRPALWAELRATHQADAGGGISLDPSGVMRRVIADAMEKVVFIVAVERRLTNKHLIEKHSKGPPIHRTVVLEALENLQQGHTLRVM